MTAPYENLVAWQRADELFLAIHRLTRQKFPGFEQVELARQIRRAAFSVAANIAEGNSRRHDRDVAHFFNVAIASLAETSYGLHVGHRLGYLTEQELEQFVGMVRGTAAPLHGLIRSRRAGPVRSPSLIPPRSGGPDALTAPKARPSGCPHRAKRGPVDAPTAPKARSYLSSFPILQM